MNVSHSYNSSSNQQLGVIVLNSDGSISESSGELMNDKKTAQIISWIISSIQMNECANPSDGHFNTITIQFADHSYWVHISPNKSTVIKCKLNPTLALNT